MISTALRIDIERWAEAKDGRALFRMAREGTLTSAMVTRYIADVTYMIRLTPGHLESACRGARARGDETLARHYEHKIREEVGHAAWGEADLESLTRLAASPAVSPATTPSILALADYVTAMIERDPSFYLTYLAFTEYVTVLLGPELLAHIEERCGIPKSSLTVIDNHIELDRDHAEEGFGLIDDLVGDPRMLAPMRQSLAGILEHFDAFCEEVTDVTALERHVSAA
jgi:hypothetical protein